MAAPPKKRQKQELGNSRLERESSQLHPLNPYRKKPPDYKALAERYPDGLGKFLSPDGSINFTDARAVVELNRALLHADMGLSVEFHESRLCPPVPNRLNYLCWLSELLQLRDATDTVHERKSAEAGTYILDIGVGASCIYPLLGAHVYGWNFYGVDIDEESLACARRNVEANPAVSSRINLAHVPTSADAKQKLLVSVFGAAGAKGSLKSDSDADCSSDGTTASAGTSPAERLQIALADTSVSHPDGPLTNALKVLGGHARIDAVLTNPPFYTEDEVIERNPRTICTGSPLEMATVGGEVAFVGAIVADSLALRNNITWFTATLGKKSSLNPLLTLLSGLGITNVRTVRFMGGVTTRWAIAWSFTSNGEHVLPKAGQSADPKTSDIASLDKCLVVESAFDITCTDVQETILAIENKNKAKLSVVHIISERVRRAIALLVSGNTQWNYSVETLHASAIQGTVRVCGNVLATCSVSSVSIPDIDFRVAIAVTSEGKAVHIALDCTCKSVAFVVHARHACDILKMEIQRSNRKWRREIAKDKESVPK